MEKLFVFSLLFFVFLNTQAQWTRKWGEEKSFIENKGQFESLYKIPEKNTVLYAYDGSQEDYFFLKNQLIFRFVQLSKKEKDELKKEMLKKK